MTTDCEVLICGLGPVGQLLALLLAELGVRVIAVELADAPYDLPRAAVIDDEVLRILQGVGLDQRVLADACAQPAASYVTHRGRVIEVLATVRGELGHPPLVSIHQPSMERTMVGALAERGAAQLWWGRRLEAIEQAGQRVTVSARPSAGGPAQAITCRYLVGCDGSASTVRSLLGLRFDGLTFAQRWLVVDTTLDRPLARAPHVQFVGDVRRPSVTLPMSPGRHRWEWMLQPGEDQAPFLEHRRIRELIEPWVGGEQVAIERAVIYTFHARTAERWRVGRVLLAGDAAHVMPPFVGQGFSSGARDAGNLAWKLHAVLNGAPGCLLDSYEAERRPHVTSMQKLAVRWGGVVQTADPRVGRIRDATIELLDRSGGLGWIKQRVKPRPTYGTGAFASEPARLGFRRSVGALFPQPTVGGRRLDELLGPGWSAVSISPAATASLRDAGLPVIELGRSEWLSRHRTGWAMLRPDRYVFACGGDGEIAGAVAARRSLLGAASSAPRAGDHEALPGSR